MPASRKTQSLGGKLGSTRKYTPGADTTDIERDLAASKIEDRVREIVAAAPPLTEEQRQRISALLAGGR